MENQIVRVVGNTKENGISVVIKEHEILFDRDDILSVKEVDNNTHVRIRKSSQEAFTNVIDEINNQGDDELKILINDMIRLENNVIIINDKAYDEADGYILYLLKIVNDFKVDSLLIRKSFIEPNAFVVTFIVRQARQARYAYFHVEDPVKYQKILSLFNTDRELDLGIPTKVIGNNIVRINRNSKAI